MRKRNFVLFVSLALITWAGVTYHLFLQRPLASKAFRPGKLQSQLEQLEQKLQEQVRANAELLGNLRDLKKQLSEPSNDTGGRQSGDKPVIAVLLFACNRVTVKRPIDQLIQYRPSKEQFPIIVSQDCNHAMTTNVIKAYGNELTLIRQPDQSDIPLVGKEKKFKGYYKIARHYGWALNKTFHDLMYDTVIIVEDDLELSAGLVAEDSEHLHRSDFFPGLGWMLTKDLWLELHTKWPKSFWDDWIRQPEQRRDRACIRPEVSRTKTFGKIGVSKLDILGACKAYILPKSCKLQEEGLHIEGDGPENQNPTAKLPRKYGSSHPDTKRSPKKRRVSRLGSSGNEDVPEVLGITSDNKDEKRKLVPPERQTSRNAALEGPRRKAEACSEQEGGDKDSVTKGKPGESKAAVEEARRRFDGGKFPPGSFDGGKFHPDGRKRSAARFAGVVSFVVSCLDS
ncbi:alpha-1,3-mannosyl-glycoprotein 2-beta-N-acetylglucosaminyltransferase [Ixodes scapularis]